MDISGDGQEQTKSDDGTFQLTRRSVLIGTAAIAASGSAYADGSPTENLLLDFLDKIRRQVVVLVDVSREDKFKSKASTDVVTAAKEQKFLLSWDRRDFGPNASFRIDRVSGQYFRDGRPTDSDKPEDPAKVATWLPLKWTLTVSNSSFPGNEKFPGDPRRSLNESTIVFTFVRTKLDKPWNISATMTRWWESRAGQLIASEVSLKDFCDGTASLGFAVNSEQNRLLSSLFGERIEARTPFRLEVDRGIQWSIDAGERAATAKVGRLYILDIPLEFGRLKLTRVRSDLVSATDQRSKTSAGEVSEEAPGDAKKFLFETEVTHGRPLKVSDRFHPDGLYGAIENVTGFTTPNTDTPESEDIKPIWKFNFAAKRLDGVDTSVALEFDRPAISFRPPAANDRRALVAAAIRHWGYPDHTVAGCVVTSANDLQGIGRLNVKHGPAKSEITEGPFEFAGFEIVRQYHAKAGAVITRLSAHPVSKETAVGLQLGSIGVAGLPPVSSKPGVAPRVPQIVVEATETVDAADKDRRQLSGFSAGLALNSAAIRLPERVEAEPGKAAAVFPGKHVTRLDFQDADALLYLPALGPHPASSADAVLPIGPARPPGKAIFDLGRARLTVLRPSDLLALKFRFSGLELVAPWPPARDKVAELAPRGGRSPGRPFAQTASGSAAPRDERPLLVVEFPPQHVVEQAYFRQLPEKLDLPELDPPPENAADIAAIKEALAAPKKWSRSRRGKAAAQWRSWVAELVKRVCGNGDEAQNTTGCERTALRKALRVATNWPDARPLFPNAPANNPPKRMADFDSRFAARASALPQPLPEEQCVYIGADYLEPDARRIALDVLRELKQEEEGAGKPIKWPVVKDLEKGDWKDFFRPFVESKRLKGLDDVPEQEKWPDKAAVDKAFGADNDLLGQEVLNEIERARERRDHDYAAFRQTYRMLARATSLPPQQREYFGKEWFLQLLALKGTDKLPDTFVSDLTKALSATDQEAFATVVPARLSGPSRIAFRVDCDDFEPDRLAGRIPFTLEGLTNWGGMDMVVVRRAERLMEPLQGTRLPPRWGRRALTDEGAMLRFQGFTSSERWGAATETRRREPAQAAVTAAQRLAEVYASSARAPDLFETAIELPFRLFLSPAQDATWMTTAPRVRRDAGFTEDVDAFRELWTARLTGREQEAGVRAVWSPDYRPEALLSTAAPGAPPIGPYAPWALPRSFGLRTSPDREIERFRTGLEAFDRHELVVLSSVHGLPVLGRRAPTGDLAPDADQIEPPAGFRLRGLLPEKIENQDTDMTAIYRPKPLSVNELSLSALGGNLDVDAGFQPPASARSLLDRHNLFDALSIERWRQRTVLGRDIVVEVVYKGFLFPLGHRASLVKLTERRFMKVDGRESPMAILVQRLFLKIGKPEKRYQAEGQPNRGSRWPCERIVMLTRQTPDLVDARSDEPDLTSTFSRVFSRGRIGLGPGTTGVCMWPRTSARDGAEVWFEMQIGDEAVPVRLPLIFVDNTAANDETTVAKLIEYYNDATRVAVGSGVSPTRLLLRNGQPVVMAPEYKPGDTTFDTAWWRVTAEGRERNPPQKTGHDPIVIDNANYIRDSFMEGQDQPPFYPVVDRARCRLKSVERFTGSGPLWADVTFDGDYVAYGIDYVDPPRAGEEKGKPSEIYLRILQGEDGYDTLPLDFENRGELGGGVARPTMDVVAISRSLGPINGGTKGAPPGAPAPAPPSKTSNQLPVLDRIKQFEDSINIFPKGKFLGIMELSKLVEAILGIDLHPKLTDVIEYGAASLKSVAGDAANEVAGAVVGAATDVRSALTQALISPAADAVAEVQKAWIEIAKKRLGGDAQVPNLADIYPQVGTDIAGLRDLLDRAKRPDTSDVAFFDSLSAILEAARRLARTIDAIARDPLAAAAGAQVELFRKLLEPIEAVRAALNDFDKIGELPKQLPDMLREIARKILIKKIKRIAQIVDESTAPAQSVVKIVEDSVNESLPAAWTLESLAKFPNALATRLKDKITPLGPDSYEFQTLDPVLTTIKGLADEIAQVEQATADAKKDLAALEKEADAAAQEQIARLRETADQIERRAIEKLIELLLSPTVMTVLRIVADTPAMRAAIPKAPLDDKKFEQLLTAVAPALDILAVIGGNSALAKLLATVDAVCANIEVNIKSTLVAASKTLLPPIGVLEIKSGGATGTDDPTLDVTCECSVPVSAIHTAANSASVALAFDMTSKDKFDKAAGKVFAQIGQLYRSLKAFNDEVALLPTAGCAPLKSDLIVKMRDVAAQQRALSMAMENLAKTTVEILTSPSLQAAAQTAARGALIEFLVAVIEKTPDLTLLNSLPKPGVPNNPFDEFAAAITKLADLLRPTLPRTAGSLDRLAADQRALGDLDFRKKALEEAKKTLILGVAEFRNSGTLGVTAQNALNGARGQLILAQKATFARMERAFSADLYDLLVPAVAQIEDSLNDVIDQITSMTSTVVGGALPLLITTYDLLLRNRTGLNEQVAKAPPVVGRVLDLLARELGAGQTKADLFNVYDEADKERKSERLTQESIRLKAANAKWATDQAAAMAELGALADAWRRPALVELIRRFGRIKSSFLRIVVVEALDLRALRSELDRIIRELVPTRATLSYDLGTPVREFSLPGVGKVFLPAKGTRLDVKMRASIDLLNPQKPDARIDGHMGPFGIQLFGDFDVVLLNFRGLDFRAGGGRPSGFDVRFGDFVIGEKAKFLKQLEAFISPKGGLPPVRPMKDKPGIEATYGINLGSFGVGTLSFSNVSLNAGARLPFGATDEAEFIVSIGRSDAPFLISSTIFGGGGYLALLANGKGFIGLETSFDYGGVFTFGFGPLSGTGQITLGLYFRAARGEPSRLGMNFMVRAAANIACFSFSVSLFVRLTYVGGQMNGSATFTFSFSIGIDDIDFTVEAFVSQGASAGSGSPTSFLDLPGMPALTQFASASPEVLNAYARAGGGPQQDMRPPKPKLCVNGPSQKKDWTGYHDLFDPTLDPIVKIFE